MDNVIWEGLRGGLGRKGPRKRGGLRLFGGWGDKVGRRWDGMLWGSGQCLLSPVVRFFVLRKVGGVVVRDCKVLCGKFAGLEIMGDGCKGLGG